MNSNENISACTGITMNEKEVPHNPANEDYGLCSASVFFTGSGAIRRYFTQMRKDNYMIKRDLKDNFQISISGQDTWYSKLLGVVILLIVVFLLFHILVAVIPFFAVLALILFIVSLIKNRN